jgi:pre-mRNA-splicing factor 38A
MAQTSAKWATSVHGTNPQNMIEYIMRQKIYDSLYWKQHCFGLSAEALVDKAVELSFVGGMFGEPRKPTDFACLLLKLLQIAPDKEIIVEFIQNDEFKYLRVLGAFYFRLVGRAPEIYRYLEPLLNDYRRIRIRKPDGTFSLSYIDEVIDQLLTQEFMFNIALPRLTARAVLEASGQLPPRISTMQDEFDRRKNEIEDELREKLSGEAVYEFSVKAQKKREKWKLGKGVNNPKKRKTDMVQEEGEIGIEKDGGEEDGEEEGQVAHDGVNDRGGAQSMSVEETNRLRATLGLQPLK